MAWTLLSYRMSMRCLLIVLLVLVSGRSAAAVVIVGIQDALLDNARLYLGDVPACAAADDVIAEYTEQLPERLRPALDAFGYYSAEITIADLPSQADCWRVEARIDLGPPVLVRSVTLRLSGAAESDPDMSTLFAQFPLAAGDRLEHGTYQAFKNVVDVLARQRGYLEGAFAEQRIDVFVEEASADITLAYESGPRYRFGAVSFDTDVLSDGVLRSFLGFEEGDPYDAALVGRLQSDLLSSRYFARVNVTADLGAASGGSIPVRVDAVGGRPTRYSVGGGYSTDDGPRVRLAYDNDRHNRAGHQMEAQALLARARQTGLFEYQVPVGNPQRDWRSYRVGLARDDFVAGVGAALKFSIRRTRVGEQLTVTRFADMLVERTKIADFSFSSYMLVPGIAWLRNYRDDLARPREGHQLSLVLTGGFGSDVSLLRLDFRGKWITAMPWEGRLLLRGRAGTLHDNGEFGYVPLSMRFFAGGDSSIRGFEYQSLGPRNQFGNLIGGNRLLEASVEYEHPFLDDWALAVFVDSGNAFRDSDFEVRTGAGFGARWFSPLGPIRLDVAWPLNGPDRSPRLHFSLGPDL